MTTPVRECKQRLPRLSVVRTELAYCERTVASETRVINLAGAREFDSTKPSERIQGREVRPGRVIASRPEVPRPTM